MVYKNARLSTPKEMFEDFRFFLHLSSRQVVTMDPAIEHDVEKQAETENLGAVSSQAFEYGNSPYAKLQRLAGKLKVEQRGIERVPDNERADSSYLNIGSMVRFCDLYPLHFQYLTCHSGLLQIWLSHPSRSVP